MLHVDLIAPIGKLLDRHAKERPEQVAYWDSSRSITYAQLAMNTATIAANLAKAGVREGDRIAIYLPNGVDWIEACLAGLRAGAVVVPISFEAAEGEISYRLTDASCGTVITTPVEEGPGREDLARRRDFARNDLCGTRGATGGLVYGRPGARH